MNGQGTKREKIITDAMISFINKHIPSCHLDTLDDIVMSYVVTVLENLVTDAGSSADLTECFDIDEFTEMLTAYFPEFASIEQADTSEWIFELVTSLQKGEDEKSKASRQDLAFESLLGEIDQQLPRAKHFSESSSDGSCNGSKAAARTPRVSETSDTEADVAEIIERMQMEDKVQTLMEMFPTLPKSDAMNFVVLTNGDLEKTVQMVLLVMETGGLSLNGAQNGRVKSKQGKSTTDEKSLKDRIVQRYGFIDQAEDAKEFRPTLPKAEPKKMLRYRDNQVVSTKGERYTEMRVNKDGVEVKNYIAKPHKMNK